jgi:SPP1 gp7 family putative phage head morphogenesis protein
MPSLRQLDPSMTVTLRRAWSSEVARRYAQVSRAVRTLVVADDAFGLAPNPNNPVTFNIGQFSFRTEPEKVAAFRAWLGEQFDIHILTNEAGKPWVARYIDAAHKKGKLRGYQDVDPDFLDSKAGVRLTEAGRLLSFGLGSFADLKRVEMLYTRAFGDLKGVNEAMAQQMSRILANGFMVGDNPLKIASAMTKAIAGLSKSRAELIAQTETIAAHAEGQLDAYEEMRIPQVEVMAEWLTAGDDRVCEKCSVMSGRILTIEEARGIIPLHPRCRCCWAPYTIARRVA